MKVIDESYDREPLLKKAKMSMEKRIIYFCVDCVRDDICKWFRVDLSSIEGNITEEISMWKSIEMPPKYPHDFNSVALGSKIYAVGGGGSYKRGTDYIWCENDVFPWVSKKVTTFDTSAREGGDWKPQCDLVISRRDPQVVALDGKIYAMSSRGDGRSEIKPWGEVYDPEKNLWEPLSAPVDDFTLFSSAVYEDQKAIIVISSLCDYIFRPCLNKLHPQWQRVLLPVKFGCNEDSNAMVIGGNVMYLFDTVDKSIYVYDLEKHGEAHEVKGDFLNYVRSVYVYGRAYLVYTGNDELCLIWAIGDRETNTKVCFLRFRVEKNNLLEWTGSVIGYIVYNVIIGGSLAGCVQLDD